MAKNNSGPAGGAALIEATGGEVSGRIPLPYLHDNGTQVFLGDANEGYPPALYPNLTFSEIPISESAGKTVAHFHDTTFDERSGLLLGPYVVNQTFSMVSMTLPVINNTSSTDVLGWMTVVFDARLITDVLRAQEGLDRTGNTLLIGPANLTNKFAPGIVRSAERDSPADVPVRFVYPVNDTNHRHPNHAYGTANPVFNYDEFPALVRGLTIDTDNPNNAGNVISTVNEAGKQVAVGFAMPNTPLVDWIVLVEQAKSEVWQPIYDLRNLILACVFGTFGALLILLFPIAHYSSAPIRRLRDATKKSVAPPGYLEDGDDTDRSGPPDGPSDDEAAQIAKKEGFLQNFSWLRHASTPTSAERREEQRRRAFRIPSKVKDRRHFIHDELTDLTQTFNEMTDELMMQYEKLEERVQQRTAELELSKKAAEAANESKTLFIANISHELKTPLNGILGMCAVCMSEDDPGKLKRSLGIIYKSGDLLNNLLTDLLTFSKNQVGQHLTLDEKEFWLRDVSSQILAIFDKQAKESGIKLEVKFEGSPNANHIDTGIGTDRMEYGPFGTGRVKDMILWGDPHRIMQVIINLVSNSLKFTPSGGFVTLTIRCLGDADRVFSRKASVQSKDRSGRNSRQARGSELSTVTPRQFDTATEINALERINSALRSSDLSPSPIVGRTLVFEFEVQDTGPGVPQKLQQRIFEPFVQGDLGLSKKHGGTGLGLSICSQLAGLMNGTISLRSEEGHGSTFAMQIPLKHLSSQADSTASSSVVNLDSRRNSAEENRKLDDARSVSSQGTGAAPVAFESDSKPRLVGLRAPFFAASTPLESPNSQVEAMERVAAQAMASNSRVKVLVAEDNKTNQEVVLRMLKLEDVFDVTVVEDGQEAYDKVKESMESHRPFNLIFMDVQMPNVNGLESTRLIRKTGYTAPIVALSAYSEESNVKECLESGMNDFISKPIRRPRLKQVLKTFCSPIPEVEEDIPTPLDGPSVTVVDSTLGSTTVSKVPTNQSLPNGVQPDDKGSPSVSPLS